MRNPSSLVTRIGATNGELVLVKIVAKLTPWFAPFPSAYFVARSSLKHLQIPLLVVIVIAAIVEFLGLTSVHTWLWLSDWNNRKRKNDPSAPAVYALVLCFAYLTITIGLTILLEILPALSIYAPGLFPALALIGAFNLALISQQEARENEVKQVQEEQRAERQAKRSGGRSDERSESRSGQGSEPVQVNGHDVLIVHAGADDRSEPVLNRINQARKVSREDALNELITFYAQYPGASYSTAGQAVHRSKAWVSDAIAKLELAGKLRRSGLGIEIVQQD